MARSLHFSSEKSGLPPGSLVHVGKTHDNTSICVINYNGTKLEKHTIDSIEDCLHYQNTDTITWVVINGLKDVAIIDAIGKHFNIHALVLEDILNTHQRPKLEEFSDYLYIVMKAVTLERSTFSVGYEQISLLLLPNFVFTFREKPDDLFQPVIDRLAIPTSHVRCFGADYLTYVLIDAIIDEYFTMQDNFDELIEEVEDELLLNPSAKTLVTIQKIRRELIFLRRTIAPLRELLKSLHRSSESALLDDRTRRYFGDVYDHVIRISESAESYRDLIASMLDIYLSSISNKMNETMKVLTVFASIFIPLTFIAGVYGMNFEYMPELKWRWGYPVLWSVFIGVSVFLLVYFKRKKWL
ncbi:magnesium/cobalt transporter CorA [Crenothrix polyspora]|uniref:Magnesium transport protein CorA n=1 Tax=Crenothrix polyspora TaxID=360316 RepID=A0A1R4H1C3_9GAMM|nr:magnesium/cobalt transporter CorA [Crenothrix polyspora]SJM90034.1 Magnesium transport protein CorA [Crenothrix polyspora]